MTEYNRLLHGDTDENRASFLNTIRRAIDSGLAWHLSWDRAKVVVGDGATSRVYSEPHDGNPLSMAVALALCLFDAIHGDEDHVSKD